MINDQAAHLDEVEHQIGDLRGPLERALIATFGLDDGLDAAAEAVAYGIEHSDRVAAMDNPVGYLYRVGQTAGSRLSNRWSRIGALVEDPRTTDAVLDLDLQRALLALKPDERVSIVLVHAHGHSYAEAADILDFPITTLTNHLHRGLTRLRIILESQ